MSLKPMFKYFNLMGLISFVGWLLTFKEKNSSTSPEETANRRLLGLIYDLKGDYEASFEHYVLPGIAMEQSG
ncbi:hypothetical protein FXO38_17312 [Capsicum annuum]|uniref:Uncharacterized protein n=1 Tax=Capsicum annuum TaxID=4072 RepID=A0A2G2XZN4_CAPAN|nr:hypothetical protein FXO37_23016 [Capsicum annuum]KAF3650166.1 hypothetical protein FXO38_17312 [Capsicum annuum]PHT62919.1 hypothetical protein T459_33206 [Capsicum annuum]